jgi:hypothetical protein
VRAGERHDLAGVGRIGQHLVISAHGRVENHFTRCRAFRPGNKAGNPGSPAPEGCAAETFPAAKYKKTVPHFRSIVLPADINKFIYININQINFSCAYGTGGNEICQSEKKPEKKPLHPLAAAQIRSFSWQRGTSPAIAD